MIKSERRLPVTGGGTSVTLSLTPLVTDGRILEFKHRYSLAFDMEYEGDLSTLSESELDLLFLDLESTYAAEIDKTGKAEVRTFAPAARIKSRKSVAAVRAKRKRISQGQARVAVQIEQLFTRLESEDKYGVAAVMSEGLRGDPEVMQALSVLQSKSSDVAEFFVILGALQDIKDLRDDLAYTIACLPAYPVQGVSTEPEFLKTPEQILCGAVSIKAPPALPTDVIPFFPGYAVGATA